MLTEVFSSMEVEADFDVEDSRSSNELQELWPVGEIDPKRGRFPCCIVWTPLPVVSWLAPYIGHVGICQEDGSVLDFAGSNLVSMDNFAYGSVARYLQLDRKKCCFPANLAAHVCEWTYKHAEVGTATSWDVTLQLGARHFQHKYYTASCPRLHPLTNTQTQSLSEFVLQRLRSSISGMILSAFLLLFCAVFTWTVFPKRNQAAGPHGSTRRTEQPYYATLDQVKAALQHVGLESSNLIIGVDFTKSNEWTGKLCFDGRSLHHLGTSSSPNPYERAIGIVGDTLSAFDEDNVIPCFGFGDMSTHDQDVFRFFGDGRACVGVPEVLQRYREIAAGVRLSGPTSLAPIIEAAMGIVQHSGYQYHILLIIADGQVPRCSCAHCASNLEETRSENYIEERTLQALIHASHFPLSIVLVGVGDGPWEDDLMNINDSRCQFDNFQFVDFTKIMSAEVSQAEKEDLFALEALKKIPTQYAAIISQRISDLAARAPARTPLPPPC